MKLQLLEGDEEVRNEGHTSDGQLQLHSHLEGVLSVNTIGSTTFDSSLGLLWKHSFEYQDFLLVKGYLL